MSLEHSDTFLQVVCRLLHLLLLLLEAVATPHTVGATHADFSSAHRYWYHTSGGGRGRRVDDGRTDSVFAPPHSA
eukprot:COSAG02_NODE_968_length_15583_cov_13.420369_4_plen_75_part_00